MTCYAVPPAETGLPLRALASGLLPGLADFAGQLATYLGASRCVLAGSGRALLYLLLDSLRRRASREQTQVLIPAYTCYSVAAATVKAGLDVGLYDVDPSTFQPDFEDLRRKINSRTLAVVGQHLLGVSCDVAALAEIAHAYGAWCIEDSAQRLVQTTQSSDSTPPVDYSIFSFGRGKPLPLGGGGALIASDADGMPEFVPQPVLGRHSIKHRLTPIAVRLFAWPRLYWILEQLPLGLGQTIYDPSFLWSAMSATHQRIGAAALVSLERLNRHRVTIGQIYNGYFGDLLDSAPAADCVPYLRYPLLVKNASEATRLAHRGVRSLYPLALCDLPALQIHRSDRRTQMLGAREIARRLVTLPTHSGIRVQAARELAAEVNQKFHMAQRQKGVAVRNPK